MSARYVIYDAVAPELIYETTAGAIRAVQSLLSTDGRLWQLQPGTDNQGWILVVSDGKLDFVRRRLAWTTTPFCSNCEQYTDAIAAIAQQVIVSGPIYDRCAVPVAQYVALLADVEIVENFDCEKSLGD